DAGTEALAAYWRECGDNPHPELLVVGFLAVERPSDGGPHVVELGAQPRTPESLVGAGETETGVVRERRVVLGVPPAPPVGVTVFVDAVASELTQCLVHC